MKEDKKRSETTKALPLRLNEKDDYKDPVTEESFKSYRCRACGLLFPTRKELDLHWQRSHSAWKKKKRR